MLQTIIISAAASLVLSLLFSLAIRVRNRVIDSNDHPTLRYIAVKFLMSACGLVFFAFGLYQWLEPLNRRYSGNLLILSYIPIALAVLSYFMAAYLSIYRITLLESFIEVRSWPFGSAQYKLSELQSIEEKQGQRTVTFILHFKDGHNLIVYPMLSGVPYFMERLHALTLHSSGTAQKRPTP